MDVLSKAPEHSGLVVVVPVTFRKEARPRPKGQLSIAGWPVQGAAQEALQAAGVVWIAAKELKLSHHDGYFSN